MKKSRLPLLGLSFYRRTNFAVLLGMAVGAAVLTGALIVGDSIRGSLRRMTLERLGKIDDALSANRFFREGLVADLAENENFSTDFAMAAPAIYLNGSVEQAETSALANGANVIGIDEPFWKFDISDPWSGSEPPALEGRTAILNEQLAREIGASPGDAVLVRIKKSGPIPEEAVHGRRTGNIVTMRLTVSGIVPNRGLGRFGLLQSQQLPSNVYIPLPTIQRLLDQTGQVNTILVAAREDSRGIASRDRTDGLGRMLDSAATLEDYQLKLRINPSPAYLSLESSRMVLREIDAKAARLTAEALGIATAPTLTYLANTISIGDREIPYSTVTALDAQRAAPLGPLELIGGSAAPELGENDILLNTWAAQELDAKVGDSVHLTYYATGPHGQFETDEAKDFVLRGIVKMKGVGGDPGLTPEYPGIADARSIRDWDPPFKIDLSKIRDRDEAYWKKYKGTPKAFIALRTGLRLWTSRFGRFTSIRMAAAEGKTLRQTAEQVAAQLRDRLTPAAAGLVFQPIKQRGLEASKGASDFGMLFIGFSFFIIVSAMLLVQLLFSLGVERRAREIGLLLATGYTGRDVRRIFMTEGAVLALGGGVMGLALGVGYAALMLHGLTTWWIGSVRTTFLWLHVTPPSLAIGFLTGALAGLLSVYFSVRALSGAEPGILLTGGAAISGTMADEAKTERRKRRETWAGHACALVAVASIGGSASFSAGARAGLFFLGGAGLLVAALCYLSVILRSRPQTSTRPGSLWPVARLGVRNAARHHARSVLTAALVASATFIIVTVAANRHGAGHGEIRRDSGNGGFALMAESDAPLFDDLNRPEGRETMNLKRGEEALFADSRIYALRLNPGEDASCLNLYRPERPRLLGAPPDLIERGGFKFQSSIDGSDEETTNPWKLLLREEEGSIPAIGDVNTVMWILHSGLGKEVVITGDAGELIKLKIVGLLKASALQGELVISEANFLRLFPERTGYNFFMIESPEARSLPLKQRLEAGLRDHGMDVFSTRERIDDYLAVENAYLSTFQALGGLGLMLGTLGLAAVMLRNVFERRAELALLRSLGYRHGALAALVLAENGFLLLTGLTIGAGSALLSVAPNAFETHSVMPWGSLAVTLLAVAAIGMASGAVAVASALHSSLIEALRAP